VAGSGAATSYSMFVNAYDGTAWASSPYWINFDINVAAYQPPVVTAPNVTVASGATIAASSLFSVTDPEGNAITQYGLLDNTPGAGHFVVNGVVEPEGQIFYLTPAQLAETTFVAGSGAATSYSMFVNAYDGTAWASYPYWINFDINVQSAAAQHEGLSVATGGMLEVAGTESGPVTFIGSTGTLKLDAPSTFTGQIVGFSGDGTLAGSDHIDLAGLPYNSSIQSDSTYNSSTGVLSVNNGTTVDLLQFTGSYSLANFEFASDGNGGTIVYDPPVHQTGSGFPSSANGSSVHAHDQHELGTSCAHALAGGRGPP
jgi:hypothetical protein